MVKTFKYSAETEHCQAQTRKNYRFEIWFRKYFFIDWVPRNYFLTFFLFGHYCEKAKNL